MLRHRPENIYPNLQGVFPTKDDKEKQRGGKKKKKEKSNRQGEKKGGEIKETYAQRSLV